MHTVGPGIWRENWKSRKMRTTHFRTWNIARKTEKGGNFWTVHCRTWNLARKLKIMENEKHPLDDLKNDEITKKREKWEMHTEGPGIWWENWKSRKMRNTHFRTWNMERKTEKGGKFRNVHCRTWNMARKRNPVPLKEHSPSPRTCHSLIGCSPSAELTSRGRQSTWSGELPLAHAQIICLPLRTQLSAPSCNGECGRGSQHLPLSF